MNINIKYLKNQNRQSSQHGTRLFIGEYLKIVFILSFLFCYSLINAQTVPAVFEVDTTIKFIEVDELKNLYVITPGSSIIKYDSLGIKVADRRFSGYGEISSIDVSNPLNTEVFYSSQNKVVITDNLLNVVSELNLDGSGVSQFGVACRSESGGFWFYDIQDAKLKRLDPDKNLQGESPNLPSCGIRDLNSVYMLEKSPWVFLSVPSEGILIFDQYGAYYKKIPLKNLSRFQVVKNTVIAFNGSALVFYDLLTNDSKIVALPFEIKDAQDVKFLAHRIWVQRIKSIKSYLN